MTMKMEVTKEQALYLKELIQADNHAASCGQQAEKDSTLHLINDVLMYYEELESIDLSDCAGGACKL